MLHVILNSNFHLAFKELEGIHSRTDFDLKAHMQYSGKKMQYFDPEINEHYVPYVVETSIGLDRMFLAILSSSYIEEIVSDDEKKNRFKIPPQLAPIKLAILPLTKKDNLPEKAREFSTLFKLILMSIRRKKILLEKDTEGKMQ